MFSSMQSYLSMPLVQLLVIVRPTSSCFLCWEVMFFGASVCLFVSHGVHEYTKSIGSILLKFLFG